MDKLIITVAPCAHEHVLAEHPEIPRTPQQIAYDVIAASQAGASIAHLHVLDEQGLPTFELDAFAETIRIIRDNCDILIEGSTGGLVDLTAQQRCVSLDADVDLASLNPGSVNFGQKVYINSPGDIDFWVRRMHERNIKPDIAVFDSAFISNAAAYIEQGLIDRPALFSFVLGLEGALPATLNHVLFLIQCLPDGSEWGIIGVDQAQLPTSAWAITLGGGARGGFEDTLLIGPGRQARSSAQQIERIATIATAVGREIASPRETRQRLGMTK
jgi:3-keto-5-aminohexanoate cleavage enzyme